MVSTYTTSKLNTTCGNIHSTCYFKQFQQQLFYQARQKKQAILIFPFYDFYFSKIHISTFNQHFSPCLSLINPNPTWNTPDLYVNDTSSIRKKCAILFLPLPKNLLHVYRYLHINVWVPCNI